MSIDRVVAILVSHRTSAKTLDVDKSRALEQAISDLKSLQSVLVTQTAIDRSEWLPKLRHDFEALRQLGIWTTESIETVMEEIEEVIASSQSLEHIPIQASEDHIPKFVANATLPPDLLNSLKEAWFLHILATEPDKIVPPGKSIMTALMGSRRSSEQPSALHERVEHIMHEVFWDEAVKVLSDPLPSIVIQRLRALYTDLHTALLPLIPAKDPVMTVLALPLSPTSSPLHSALIHLGETLASLQRRCAPVRDVEIEAIRRAISEYNPASPSASAALPKLIVNTISSILKLSEVMKDDLHEFVLGNTEETHLIRAIEIQAKRHERGSIEAVCGPQSRLSDEFRAWLRLDELAEPSIQAAIARLLEALRSKHPVGCMLHRPTDEDVVGEDSPKNILPSLFLFVTPSLLYAQNLIQAIVITASLRTLVRLPAQQGHELVERLLTLLKMEIENEDSSGDEAIKLINLADEVVRAVKEYGDCDELKEARLREAVDRVLNEEDPVFRLLQKRVTDEIERVFNQQTSTERSESTVPSTMRSGGSSVNRSHPYGLNWATRRGKGSEALIELDVGTVKGFEDPSLSQTLEAIAIRIWRDVQWVVSVGVGIVPLL